MPCAQANSAGSTSRGISSGFRAMASATAPRLVPLDCKASLTLRVDRAAELNRLAPKFITGAIASAAKGAAAPTKPVARPVSRAAPAARATRARLRLRHDHKQRPPQYPTRFHERRAPVLMHRHRVRAPPRTTDKALFPALQRLSHLPGSPLGKAAPWDRSHAMVFCSRSCGVSPGAGINPLRASQPRNSS